MTAELLHAAFYHFAPLDDDQLARLKQHVLMTCQHDGLLGTLLLAHEGLNGQLAGPAQKLNNLLKSIENLENMPSFEGMRVHFTKTSRIPFSMLIVKIKPEIVTMRVHDVDVCEITARRVSPEQLRDWLRSQEPPLLIDVRNSFEHEIGSFHHAINPHTDAFHQFPAVVREHAEQWGQRPIVTFCTGGIRCEKATSWMLRDAHLDPSSLYQLDGGIIHYFQQIHDAHLDWRGALFVFDDRITLDTHLLEIKSDNQTL
jgi:UPF0176 protein